MTVKNLIVFFWHTFLLRLILGVVIISFAPAFLMWTQEILTKTMLETQVNSVVISLIGVIIITILFDRLSKFPDRRSFIYVLPTLLMVVMFLVGVLLLLRLPYSLYYFFFSGSVGFIFFTVSYWLGQSLYRPLMAYVPLGRCSDIATKIHVANWLALQTPDDSIDFSGVQGVVVDLYSDISGEWQYFLAQLTLEGVAVYNYQQIYESLTGRSPIYHLHENNLGSLLPSQSYLYIKQILDCCIVLIFLPLVLIVGIATALMIKYESRQSGGSVFFVQTRIGQGGKPFRMYKFRSMVPTSEQAGAKMAVVGDVRITKFGKFIRKMRIDELPQFINVLKGEMSLIGPRPEQPSFVEKFNETIPFYRYRHIVKPGISGWAQVMQGYVSDEEATRTKLEYDFYYIKNFSFALDVLIVIKTIQTMLTGFGAR